LKRRLTQKLYNNSGALTTTQDYIGEFVYQNGALDYLVHEEGRVASEPGGLFYEYYLKDHLGNVRQVIRNPTPKALMATMEQAQAEEEEILFTQVRPTRRSEPRHNITQGGQEVAWLNASRGEMVGPGTSQEIFEGDSVTLSVHGKFLDKRRTRLNPASFVAAGGKNALLDQLNELALNTSRAGGVNPIAVLNLVDILAKDLQRKETPEAYLIYALYDSDSNRYEVGRKVLSRNAANQHEELEEKLAIKKNGYIETFVVNETGQDVWFDNFRVLSQGSILVQETHYDPWGLELTGIGYEYAGVKKNKYLYNGKELIEDNGLQYYDHGARMYDPVIGRWGVVDPLASEFPWQSGYTSFNNNPINLIDPDGRAAVPPGKTYDEMTGEMIHDDGIKDNKVYTGTKTDGSDRKFVGIAGNGPGQIGDVTDKFNTQIGQTKSFFEQKGREIDAQTGYIGGIFDSKKRNFFQQQVTDKGPFDIKQPGKGFSQGEIGFYSFYEGKLFRYDDYGNFNYGVAAKAFGFSQTTALLGAGINQFWKTFDVVSTKNPRGDIAQPTLHIKYNMDYIRNNWYPSNMSGFTDDPRDSHMIRTGYKR
jgi:RHS repeat-associated protein